MMINLFSLQIKVKKQIKNYTFCGNKIRVIIFFNFIYTTLDEIRRNLYGECYRLLQEGLL